VIRDGDDRVTAVQDFLLPVLLDVNVPLALLNFCKSSVEEVVTALLHLLGVSQPKRVAQTILQNNGQQRPAATSIHSLYKTQEAPALSSIPLEVAKFMTIRIVQLPAEPVAANKKPAHVAEAAGIPIFKMKTQEWWKLNAANFPSISSLAAAVLAQPASSAEPERVFSTAGDIVSPLRTSLSTNNVSMLMFLRYHGHGNKQFWMNLIKNAKTILQS
jgi:hypothetical protein